MAAGRGRVLGGWALIAISALALALAFSGLGQADARTIKTKATGAMRISGSNPNQAILAAANLAPGGAVKGTATIRNLGSGPAALTLSALGLHDVAGAGGGLLSAGLSLVVRDVTHHSDAIVYTGSFGGLRTLRVGALAAGEGRQYSFEAKLPNSAGAGDDVFAGASTVVDYRWALTGSAPAKCATRLYGDAGPNRIVGTVGGDWISGGAGRDHLSGGPGRDCIEGGPGRDVISGGPGDDLIRARDGSADVVDCGSGTDIAIVDKKDVVSPSCEQVQG